MNRFLRLAVLASLCIAAACSSTVEPVHNAENIAIPGSVGSRLTDDQVGSVIKSALLNDDWVLDEQQPGMVHATLKWYDHSAEAGMKDVKSCFAKDTSCTAQNYTNSVTIIYTTQNYSLQVDPTETGNLPQGTTYHQFNHYLSTLRQDIDHGLFKAAMPEQADD